MRTGGLLGWVIALLAVTLVAGCGGGSEASGEVRLGGETERREAKTTTEPAPEAAAAPGRPATTELIGDRAAVAFEAFAEGLSGEVGLTVGAPGSPNSQRLGRLSSGVAWSTIKVAIAARVLQEAGGPKGLSGVQRRAMRSALTASDNGAADTLFGSLGSGDASAAASTQKVLRETGDTQTEVSAQGRDGFSPYGQTEWSLTEQHRFMARLAGKCVAGAASSNYLLSLMGQVVPDQQWGLGSTGSPARFKGGWGPGAGGGYLVRQMGVIEVDGRSVVVTIAAEPSDGQFASGTQMLTEVAGWVAENVDARAAEPAGC